MVWGAEATFQRPLRPAVADKDLSEAGREGLRRLHRKGGDRSSQFILTGEADQ